jgi:hypothetical protein
MSSVSLTCGFVAAPEAGDDVFAPALEAFFGSAAGLSAPDITRLVAQWQADYQAFCRRDLADRDYVYVWADGVHFRCGSSRPGCAAWWSWACASTAPRNWSPSPTANASPPTAGPRCCATSAAAGCAPRSLPSATARWGCGRRSATCSRPPATSATGSHKAANVLGCLPVAVQAGARRALAERHDLAAGCMRRDGRAARREHRERRGPDRRPRRQVAELLERGEDRSVRVGEQRGAAAPGPRPGAAAARRRAAAPATARGL